MRMLFQKWFIALSATVIIVGCGAAGGGGDTNGNSNTTTSTDTTPPTVSSTSPTTGATDIAVNSAITVTFSEAMDSSTLNSSSFIVTTSGSLAVGGAVSYTGTTATFTPSTNFGYSTTYTVTITTGAKDSPGNAMAAAYTWTFTTSAAPASSGSLDSAFGSAGIAVGSSGGAEAVALQADGKIVAAGSSVNGTENDFAVVRYNIDGSIDTTFGTVGMVVTNVSSSDRISTAIVQTDGKILVSGYSNSSGLLLRYNAEGSIDTSFGTNGQVITGIDRADIAIQSDGKILVVGDVDNDFALLRFNSDGTLDNTFGTAGMVTTSIGDIYEGTKGIALQSDSKIIVAGMSYGTADMSSGDFAMVRYNADGTLDNTFGNDGKVTTDVRGYYDEGNNVAIQSDGKILIVGDSCGATTCDSGNMAIVRYNTDGSLDVTFGTGGKVLIADQESASGQSIVVQTDGKIIAYGHSITYSTQNQDYFLVRLNSDGTLDTAFGTNAKIITSVECASDMSNNIAIQTDGKIVVGGSSNSNFAVARYLP